MQRGQLVEKSLLTSPSVGELSVYEGRHRLRLAKVWWALKVMARASCARLSKQAMYFWASLVLEGQYWRTSAMVQASANHAMLCLVDTQPPLHLVSFRHGVGPGQATEDRRQ